jgi:hypothetical protein
MTMIITVGPFLAGQVVITPGAKTLVSQQEALDALARHLTGDWGELDEHDWKQNDAALAYGFRLLSRYITSGGTVFWILTEHDRSKTTIFLPNEY